MIFQDYKMPVNLEKSCKSCATFTGEIIYASALTRAARLPISFSSETVV